MSNESENIRPGDRIQTQLAGTPDTPQKGSDYMIVEWVTRRPDGTKVIWVRRP
jgi:hypothetical protein